MFVWHCLLDDELGKPFGVDDDLALSRAYI